MFSRSEPVSSTVVAPRIAPPVESGHVSSLSPSLDRTRFEATGDSLRTEAKGAFCMRNRAGNGTGKILVAQYPPCNPPLIAPPTMRFSNNHLPLLPILYFFVALRRSQSLSRENLFWRGRFLFVYIHLKINVTKVITCWCNVYYYTFWIINYGAVRFVRFIKFYCAMED